MRTKLIDRINKIKFVFCDISHCDDKKIERQEQIASTVFLYSLH